EERRKSLPVSTANLPAAVPSAPASGAMATRGAPPRPEAGFVGGALSANNISGNKESRADSGPRTKLAMAQPPPDLDFAVAGKLGREAASKQLPAKNLNANSAKDSSGKDSETDLIAGRFDKKDESKLADAELMARNQFQIQPNRQAPAEQAPNQSVQQPTEQSSTGAVVERAKPPVASQEVVE